jgi:hypothetical protein
LAASAAFGAQLMTKSREVSSRPGARLDLLALQLNGHVAGVIGGQKHSGADRLHLPVRGIDQQELFLDTHTAPGHLGSIRAHNPPRRLS